MASCCRTCSHRNHDMHTIPSTPTLIDICLVTLHFTSVPTASHPSYFSLNALLNNITDAAESHTSFTTYSPDLSDPKTLIILTTASETCANSTSPIWQSILRHLSTPPSVQHIYLDYSILSLAATSPDEKIPVDLILLRALNPGIAGAIGKRFGWDPKRSSLSSQMEISGPGFSRPGDLIRDFWAWAEVHADPVSPSSSLGSFSDYEGVLKSTNSSEKNMSLFFREDEPVDRPDDETLVMLFQWSSHADADRFKHPLQKSFGVNGQEASSDIWDRHVAHPVRQLQGVGADVQSFRLELRGVEPRIEKGRKEARERSGSRRLSGLATGLGERMSGFWR